MNKWVNPPISRSFGPSETNATSKMVYTKIVKTAFEERLPKKQFDNLVPNDSVQ